MNTPTGPHPDHTPVESNADRLRRMTTLDAMSVELVSAFAGDREMTATEKDLIRKQKETWGRIFFSDLLYAISHQHFFPDIAATLWGQNLSHKQLISQRLGRNTRIVVAALDYLTNITADLKAATLISEARASEIANLAMRDDMTACSITRPRTSCWR